MIWTNKNQCMINSIRKIFIIFKHLYFPKYVINCKRKWFILFKYFLFICLLFCLVFVFCFVFLFWDFFPWEKYLWAKFWGQFIFNIFLRVDIQHLWLSFTTYIFFYIKIICSHMDIKTHTYIHNKKQSNDPHLQLLRYLNICEPNFEDKLF